MPPGETQSMRADAPALRPETHALNALIKATILRAQSGTDSTDAMLFMGNWHQAFPTLVLRDPVLEPVDKLVWMAVMLQARETGGRTAFPSYEYLARQTNVSSTSTIARAIAILRLTRWLTLCARVRGTSGRYQGNVYVLHDEPLPLIDALYLDRDYLEFTRHSQEHHHARVRRVAQAVADSMADDVQAGRDLTATVSVLEQRARTAIHLQNREEDKKGPRRFFDFTEEVLQQLKNKKADTSQMNTHQDQNSKADETGEVGGSCSSNNLKTTTTTTENKSAETPDNADVPLIYPARLSSNQRELTDKYLALVPQETRQAVLDELAGRIAAETQGAKPVYDELRFLFSLCRAAKNGEFVPNLGIKVAEARLATPIEKPREAPETPPNIYKSDAERAQAQEAGQRHLAQLRDALGMAPSK